jgi:hypothetical protein
VSSRDQENGRAISAHEAIPVSTISLKGAVGASPAQNFPDDVKAVQALLSKVTPPLSTRVTVNGIPDQATMKAIREFQSRFMRFPDQRVDTDNRTLWHLNEGFVSRYVGCHAHQRQVIDRDLMRAQTWLRQVISVISGNLSADLKRKLKNVFHIDADNPADRVHLVDLLARYNKLLHAFDEAFPLQCEPKANLFGAWVDLNDPTGTMHFPVNYFQQPIEERTEKIVHERSHTVLNIAHAGMTGGGQLDFGSAPDDDNGFTYQQAIANAYCYGWFATCVQPTYVRPDAGATITVPRPHH